MTSRTRRPRGDREECAAVEATANGEAEAEYLEILGVLRSIGALKTTYSNYYGPYSRVVGRWFRVYRRDIIRFHEGFFGVGAAWWLLGLCGCKSSMWCPCRFKFFQRTKEPIFWLGLWFYNSNQTGRQASSNLMGLGDACFWGLGC